MALMCLKILLMHLVVFSFVFHDRPGEADLYLKDLEPQPNPFCTGLFIDLTQMKLNSNVNVT